MFSNLIYVCLLIVLLVAVFIVRLYSAKVKGWMGEKAVAAILSSLDDLQYKVINNLVLDVYGKTVQIDHLIISDFGIFVIETKNYQGWILGGEHAEYWQQVIFNNKSKFYNPIRQNYGHVQALKKCLPAYPNLLFIPIVVFSSSATIKVNTTTKVVVNANRLLEVISSFSQPALTYLQKETIFATINAMNIADSYDKKQHVQSIRRSIQVREHSIHQNICPQCGNQLVLRNGKYGNFLGCKGYPACKFIKKL